MRGIRAPEIRPRTACIPPSISTSDDSSPTSRAYREFARTRDVEGFRGELEEILAFVSRWPGLFDRLDRLEI